MIHHLDAKCCPEATQALESQPEEAVIVMERPLSQSRSSAAIISDEAGLDGILNSLPCPVVVADRATHVRYRNAAARASLPEGNDLPRLFPAPRFPARLASWALVVRQVLEGGTALKLLCPRRRAASDASEMMTILHCCPLRSGDARGVVIVVEDGTQQTTADEPQDVSRRLASLGKLAARVAHELNNPLDGILRYTNLALRLVGDTPDSKLKSYLSETRTGLMRMVQIIGDLLEYSRSTDGEFDDAGVNEVIEEALRAFAADADERRVVVAADFQSASMPKVRGNRLYQVLCNLIRNALDAMPRGGRLTITSGLVGEEIVIRVADTGAGLPEPVERVFEPFFTTKPPGKGTGLGLAICKDFIEDIGGTIVAASGESGGAVFTLRIPKGAKR